MFGILGTSASFAQAAGRAGKGGSNPDTIVLEFNNSTKMLQAVYCTGEISVKSTYNGAEVVKTYSDLNGTSITIDADDNTPITITGAVTALNCGMSAPFGFVSKIDVDTKSLVTLTINPNTMTTMDMSKAINLGTLNLGAGANTIETLNLTNLSHLENFTGGSYCSQIAEIYYAATNDDVCTDLADAIGISNVASGVLHTDSNGAYYNVLATAATNKGWQIVQI